MTSDSHPLMHAIHTHTKESKSLLYMFAMEVVVSIQYSETLCYGGSIVVHGY